MTQLPDDNNPRSRVLHIQFLLLSMLLLTSGIAAALDAEDGLSPTSYCGDPDAVHQIASSTVRQSGSDSSDLDDIQGRGQIRILLYQHSGTCSISQVERRMIEQFAQNRGLTPVWIYVDEEWQLLPSLIDGKGEIIVAAGESLAAGMEGHVDFTLPWATSRLQVVIRTDTGQINSIDDLAVRQVAVKRSSSAWALMEEIAAQHPGIDLVEIPSSLNNEMIMQRVASGQYDVTVVDSLFLESYLPQHPELSVAFDLSEGRSMAWGVRTKARKLYTTLNQFLNKNHLKLSVGKVYLDDLPKIQQRHVLRVITYQNPSHYFLRDGRLYGFEYELVKKFAKAHNLRVGVVLASSHEEMQDLLLQGKGDVIAASLPVPTGEAPDHIQYTKSYHFAAPVIVGRDTDERLLDVRDLEGRRITLSAESPYRTYLESLRDRGIDFDLAVAEKGISTEAALFMVAMGMYDLTVAGSHQIKSEFARQIGLESKFVMSEPQGHVWAVRSTDHRLLSAMNAYIEREYRSEFYNVVYSKYFTEPVLAKGDARLLARVDRLSPFDEIARTNAERYSFDWRLIVALMFQESRFNPLAESDAGAEGLMQLLPETAAQLGITNPNNPESSIHAGVRYLDLLRSKFENELLLEVRTWFSLASYNAGYNRVKRARRIAEKMGLDKNRWFDNVEKAMLASSVHKGDAGAGVRLCRCGQTVAYVREIRTRYNNYVRLTEAASLASSDSLGYENIIEKLN
ncbi:MAG: transporter substrate-binding domain-containing protein [Gammaproteobacteria bacterium]